MTGLEPREDQVVRDAVDAYLDGSLGRRFEGEMAFETKNSRYRLVDGTLFSAPDSSLVGAELVGWFYEAPMPVVDLAWKPGARAVLVDRNRGRHIIVTSGTRALHVETPTDGSTEIEASAAPSPAPVAPIPQSPPIPARRVAPHLPPRPVGYLSPLPPRPGSSPAIESAAPRPASSPAIQVTAPRPASSPAIQVAAPRPAPHPAPRPASSPAIRAAASPRPPRPGSSPAMQAPSPPPGGYVLPQVQPPPMRAAAPKPQGEEDSEDLKVTEERPLPLVVRRASPGADASTPVHDAPANGTSNAPKTPTPRGVQRGALLR